MVKVFSAYNGRVRPGARQGESQAIEDGLLSEVDYVAGYIFVLRINDKLPNVTGQPWRLRKLSRGSAGPFWRWTEERTGSKERARSNCSERCFAEVAPAHFVDRETLRLNIVHAHFRLFALMVRHRQVVAIELWDENTSFRTEGAGYASQ